MKITATNSTRFTKIEEILDKLKEDFTNKFESAEFVLEGWDDIKLTSLNCFDEEIVLPKGFIIGQIQYHIYPEYKKDKDDMITEKQKYRIEIEGTLEDQKYKLIYNNLYTIGIKIRVELY
jgi:hypothetical protein